ncbi:hypothetical protein, partial [Salmonella enterica]|uniref:hypothetical protein n=1 Tax=Salmonella enterica TaxID=28901 RepID=UPI003F1BD0A6
SNIYNQLHFPVFKIKRYSYVTTTYQGLTTKIFKETFIIVSIDELPSDLEVVPMVEKLLYAHILNLSGTW